jgi:hypothetical protein
MTSIKIIHIRGRYPVITSKDILRRVLAAKDDESRQIALEELAEIKSTENIIRKLNAR